MVGRKQTGTQEDHPGRKQGGHTKRNPNSTPEKTCKVRPFSNPEGTNEGKTLLGSKSVTTNGTGDISFTFSTKKAIRLGQNIRATATSTSTDDTPAFSAPRKVVEQ